MIDRKRVIYVAHPVTGDARGNCERVLGWIRWLTKADPSRIYIAPWIPEVLAHLDMDLTQPEYSGFYDRVLEDDCEVVRHLDGILVCGGRLSQGMMRELATAALAGKDVYNLLEFKTWEDAAAVAGITGSGTKLINECLALGST